MSDSLRRISQTRRARFGFKRWIVPEGLRSGLAGGEEFEDVDHAHPHAADTGPIVALFRAEAEACEQRRRVHERETQEKGEG